MENMLAEHKAFSAAVSEYSIDMLNRLYLESRDPEILLERAKMHSDNGDLAKAIFDVDEARRKGINHPDVSLLLANLQARHGDYKAAIDTIEELSNSRLRLPPLDVSEYQFRFHIKLAQLHHYTRSIEKTRSHLKQALDIKPDSYAAIFYQGRLELEEGKDDTARPLLERAAELCPDAPEPHYYLGQILRRRGDAKRASLHMEKSHELDPFDPRFENAMRNARADAAQPTNG